MGSFLSCVRSLFGGRALVQTAILVATLLHFAAAQVPVVPVTTVSSANLSSLHGTYQAQMRVASLFGWSASKTCTFASTQVTYFGGGQIVDTKVTNGQFQFNGQGDWSFSGTELHDFNQAASNATVAITCPAVQGGNPTINNGYAVFDGPSAKTANGTYVVNSDGSGSILIGGQVSEGMYFNLAGFNSSGLAMTALMYSDPATNNDLTTVIAVHK